MFTYNYDKANNVINTFAEGVIEMNDILDLFDRYLNDATIAIGAVEVVTCKDTDDINLSYSGILRIRSKYANMLFVTRISHTIFIAHNDLEFGIARMIQTIFEVIDHHIVVKRIS